MIRLVIETNSAAIQSEAELSDISQIIKVAAAKIEGGQFDFNLFDTNGNKTGWVVETESDFQPMADNDYIVAEIETGNAAFENNVGYESARILRDAAVKINNSNLDFKLMDFNGNSVGRVSEVNGVVVKKSREIIDMDVPGALRHVFKYVGTLVDGDRPSKNAADWEKIGSYTEGVVADEVAAKLCEQGHFSKIQSVGEYSPDVWYVLNDYSPSDEAYFKAHPNEEIKVSQDRYAVVLVLESGKRINYFGLADDANHAEGLAIASQSEQVLETVSVRLASLYQEFKAAGIEIGNHESDMYVPITTESKAILENYPLQKTNATKFRSNIDGVLTYDIPFSFDPFYEKETKRQSIVEARYIASEKVSFDEIDSSVNKTYEGKVMGVTNDHVVLSLGRKALIVAKSDLDRLPIKDEEVSVLFKDGKGTVRSNKERGQVIER